MAWSDVVKKDKDLKEDSKAELEAYPVPSSSRLPERFLSSREGIGVAVVDANALITSASRLLGLSQRFVTIKEVLDEVRDPASRLSLAALPFTVHCIEPSEIALRKVVQFARETGDLHSLSDVDLKLIALCYSLEEEKYGLEHLRAKPPQLQVFQTKGVQERDLPGWGSNVPNLEEWEELSQGADDVAPEGSHILGLKSLFLDVPVNTNAVAETDEKQREHEELGEKEDERATSCQLNPEGGFNSEDSPMFGMKNLFLDVPVSPIVVEETGQLQREYNESGKWEENKLKPCEVNSKDEGNWGCTLNSKEAEALQIDGVREVREEGEEWQRAVSWSTRRKHLKRQKHAKEKNSMGESPENFNKSIQAGEFKNDGVVNEVEELCDAQEHATERLQDESDTLKDGHGIFEVPSSGGAEAASSCGLESETSWTLWPLSSSTVACITADFPMQNVLLQIGLRVLSPNGLQVRQLHRWMLKCEACRNVTDDVGRIFCPKCGNGGTLFKVSVTTGPNGVIYRGQKRRPNIRGTKYSLPLPKGGRKGVAQNPILREDQLPHKILYPRRKKESGEELYTTLEIFGHKVSKKGQVEPPVHEAHAIFRGKRNPNDCRFKRR